jgi:2-polyprenyl-6-methoxyphenol hydroxylase-like FAD-dependent oxidoreductase
MVQRQGQERAVVIGASMGGLLAARVLAETHRRVVVIDRDSLPAAGGQRKGVPQGRHAHGLLARGREVLDELLPGLSDELVEQGALRGDIQSGVRWCNDGHLLCQAASPLQGLCVSRPLLEGQVRRRVASLPNVEVMDGWAVSGLATSPGRDGVTGVHGHGPDGIERTLDTDLVVDATGRGSSTPAWLGELGYEAPAEDRVDVHIGYATRTYRRRSDQLDGDIGVVIAPSPPAGRAGVALAMEGDRWIVTLGGYGDDRPPTDPDGWTAYAASLPRPDVAELVAGAEPLDEPLAFRYPASVRRRYERLRRFPAGYLVFGDALCSFNPIYGQGMTVAALEALALRDHLRSPQADARAFFRSASRLIEAPWQIAVGNDLRFDHVAGHRSAKVRLVNRYLARLHPVAEHDPVVALAFLRAVNLIDRPERLMAPSVAWRVLRGRRRQPSPGGNRVRKLPARKTTANAATTAGTSSGAARRPTVPSPAQAAARTSG